LPGFDGIANTRQHIRDWITHSHDRFSVYTVVGPFTDSGVLRLQRPWLARFKKSEWGTDFRFYGFNSSCRKVAGRIPSPVVIGALNPQRILPTSWT
jgi:hypothetical protein